MNLINILDPTQGIEDEAKALTEGDFYSDNFSAVSISYNCGDGHSDTSKCQKCQKPPSVGVPQTASFIKFYSIKCQIHFLPPKPISTKVICDAKNPMLARILTQTEFWLSGHTSRSPY